MLTVVFLHGVASSSLETYHSALKYLEGTKSLENVRFVAFDSLGSEKSYASDKLDYDYKCQLEALENSLKKLGINTPLVLVGHSMGTFIATRYTYDHKKTVKHLVLISPPVYIPENLTDPAFLAGMVAFKKIIVSRNKKYENDKAFNNEIKYIVMNKYNYQRLAELTTKATLIYSEADQIIMPKNIRKVAKENPKYLKAVATIGTHRVARDKYGKLVGILEEVING